MKQLFSLLTISLFGFSAHAQILVSDPDRGVSNPCDCATSFLDNSTPNFYDTGGSGSNYGNNENEVITFCPDAGGSKITLFFGTNAGFTWDVDATDFVNVYDGTTTASPLLVSANSSTHPSGISAGVTTASWANTSGCLTVEFISDGAGTGTGWEANVSCGTPWQPMELHCGAYIGAGEANGAGDIIDDMTNRLITGALPDSGYVNVCLGDSIMFVNKTVYPYEPGGSMGADAGGGYNQSVYGTGHTTEWEFSDGTTMTGDTIWFTPTSRNGYFVLMRVTDSQTQFDILTSKIRVSTIPSFATCEAAEPNICLGQYSELVGGITPGDTAGVDAVSSGFTIPGIFGNQLFLPDGSGQNYQTDILISGFPAGSTLQNAGDLVELCISMEHSFLGDLEMMLQCPNGQDVVIFNSYTGNGLVAGGFGGGGTYLGGANDSGSSLGVCEEYCFSEDGSALPAWVNGYNTVAASGPSTGSMVEPGTYNPEESFLSALAGCPINGNWTLVVRDNLGIDDGWICSWGITFAANLNPNNETYAPTIVDEMWQPDPTILWGETDTAIIVVPTSIGTHGYTFQVEDNYGCSYDTTITVEVIQGPTIIPGDTTCTTFQFSNTYVPSQGGVSGGTWFSSDPSVISFSPNNTFINPNVSASQDGEYTIYFNDNVCNDTVSATITFISEPVAILYGEDTICQNDTAQFYTYSNWGENYKWFGPSGTLISTDTAAQSFDPGIHTLVALNSCGSDSAFINLVVESCAVPNVITPNGDNVNETFYTRYAEVYDDVILIIYNRWGRVVYKTETYDNTWAGEKRNGKPVSDGVYYYVMKWDGGSKDEAGTITVFVE
ncbi:MAG: gliding motility-associated C-terminal domain-containing protein [Flavobacteriales bacterium]|nr:gliding motility-associated C-terminal domain-containing protein [Flavobacteriales bacterium]MCB9197749.1 gliding motility-associated C-terminal domain-containing protein [Flavobacteriales bacterium]